uniref:Uncharacterized protein n=1 Tax=Moniliophthora roreri TaxID=221103 RepID=A0A0W0EVT1_MONRR
MHSSSITMLIQDSRW